MARRATRQADKPVTPVARSTPPPVRAKSTKAPPTKAASAKAPAKTASGLAKLDLDGLSADQKVATLLRDREKLVTRLLAAEARISEMEAREEHLTDRISWALDTLGDLLRLPDAS